MYQELQQKEGQHIQESEYDIVMAPLGVVKRRHTYNSLNDMKNEDTPPKEPEVQGKPLKHQANRKFTEQNLNAQLNRVKSFNFIRESEKNNSESSQNAMKWV